MSAPVIGNLSACVEEVRLSALNGDRGPSDPTDFHQLRGRLQAVRSTLPPLYRTAVYDPFVAQLDALGPTGFLQVLLRDPNRESEAGLVLDIAQAILQNAEHFESKAIDAFQEVVSDLYDGFLSAEDRRGVRPPDLGVIPPLVKFGEPDSGPYTWPIEATEGLDLHAGIVSLPPANARQGLLAWSALGHETGGHDILSADTGLKAELADAIFSALIAEGAGSAVANYWASRIDETASDVLGILNMGPAAGIGLIGYFRGLSAAAPSGQPKLRSRGPSNDPHPADIVRGFLAAATVRLLAFSDAAAWANIIEQETSKDVGIIRLAGTSLTEAQAKASAEVVARTIVQTKMVSLENHALGEIQNWRNRDEQIVRRLRTVMLTSAPLPPTLTRGTFAAHVVAAAVTGALAGPNIAVITTLFSRMLDLLKAMHDSNASWGPLFIRHPGDIARHHAYVPSSTAEEDSDDEDESDEPIAASTADREEDRRPAPQRRRPASTRGN